MLVWQLTHQAKAPKIGARAPAFSLSRVDAPGKLDLASLRGKPVVLNFWASWCVPCKGEAPMLEQAWQQYRKQGVVFLGVDYHDVTGDARTFLSHHGVTYPTVQDGSGKIADSYGVSARARDVLHRPQGAARRRAHRRDGRQPEGRVRARGAGGARAVIVRVVAVLVAALVLAGSAAAACAHPKTSLAVRSRGR